MVDSNGHENYDWANFPSAPFQDNLSSFNTTLPWDQNLNTDIGLKQTMTAQSQIKHQEQADIFDEDPVLRNSWDFSNVNNPAEHFRSDFLNQPMTPSQWDTYSFANGRLSPALNNFQLNPASHAITSPHVAQIPTSSHDNPATPPSKPSASNVCAVESTDNPRVFVFRCTFPRCRTKTFGRWSDFHRHYNGAHATEKTLFWCPVAGCVRSEGTSNRGFPRKDKMMNHVWKIHDSEDDDKSFEAKGDEDGDCNEE